MQPFADSNFINHMQTHSAMYGRGNLGAVCAGLRGTTSHLERGVAIGQTSSSMKSWNVLSEITCVHPQFTAGSYCFTLIDLFGGTKSLLNHGVFLVR